MRTEKNKDGTRKVWLTREEVAELCETPERDVEQIALRLMGEIGIRVGVVPTVCYEDVKRTSDGQGYLLEVDGAKDVTGEYEGGKQRDVSLNPEVEREMFEYMHENGLDEGEPLVPVGRRSVQNYIEKAREKLAEETGDERWGYVSAHDLRRSLATYLIHDAGVQLSIVKNQMGWDSIETANNYLDAPSESVIQSEFDGVW